MIFQLPTWGVGSWGSGLLSAYLLIKKWLSQLKSYCLIKKNKNVTRTSSLKKKNLCFFVSTSSTKFKDWNYFGIIFSSGFSNLTITKPPCAQKVINQFASSSMISQLVLKESKHGIATVSAFYGSVTGT